MQRLLGPRTIAEAVFLVAVPVVAVLAGTGTWTIVGASAVAYLLVLVVETTLFREAAGPASASEATPPTPEATRVVPVVSPPLVGAAPAPVVATAGPADPVEPAPEPEPPAEPEPEPEPEPAPPPAAERPPLTALPSLPPPPAPEPPAAPPQTNVVPMGVGSAPRQWSLWELERVAREHAGGDAVRDEERTYLLMYLRDFADADGLLPVDFDALVRDSFGDLLGR